MKPLFIFLFSFFLTTAFAQFDREYSKKYFLYREMGDGVVATSLYEKGFDLHHLGERIRGEYAYNDITRDLMPPVSEMIRKHFTREELESLEKGFGKRSRAFMNLYFDYYGHIEYVVFFMPIRDMPVFTDEKLYAFYEDLKKVQLDVSKFYKWWTENGRVKEEEKDKIIAFMGKVPLFFNLKDVYDD